MKKILMIFLVVVFLVGCLFGEDWHKVRLLKVSDGDTLVVLDHGRKVKLRLMYIDTPEKYNSRKLKKDILRCKISKKKMIKLGRYASHYAEKYFRGQRYILVKYYGRGYYGRYLAEVKKLDSNSIYNIDVVRDGYSCLYKKSRPPLDYKLALEEALMKKSGLWRDYYYIMSCLCR